MEEISTSEMLGHLRTANRLFKSFEKAIEIAESLSGHEAKIASLKSELKALDSERELKDMECEHLTGEIAGFKLDASNIQKQADIDKAKFLEKARTVLDNAKAEAGHIVACAKRDTEDTLARIEELKAKEKAAKSATKNAVLKLEAAEKKVKDFKAQFADS